MIDAYVYLVTNKLTGQFYYGYRYRNQTLGINPENDLWITYFTSSNRIKNDIKKYSKEVFVANIIYRNSDSVKCWQQEQIIIRQNWGNSLLLNGKYHDPDNPEIEIYRRVNLLSESTRQKMSIASKGRPKATEHKKKIALANTGNVGSAQKRAKLSAARKGKPPANKGVSPAKYECPNCKLLISKGNLSRWHGNNCKEIDPIGHLERTAQVAAINKSK
jgi:hypothetical protein